MKSNDKGLLEIVDDSVMSDACVQFIVDSLKEMGLIMPLSELKK